MARSSRQVKGSGASDVLPEAESQVADAEPMPEVTEPALTPIETVAAETLSAAVADIQAPAPVAAAVVTDAGSGAEEEVTAAATAVVHEVDRLRGMTMAFWQDHLGRTMAAGQAIMTCGSPQAAMALQVSYLQASLASGVAHASDLARLSAEIARNIGPFRAR